MKTQMSESRGFTLIELIIIIVVLGIISIVAVAKYSDFLSESRIQASKSELSELKRAIVGNPGAVAGGRYSDVGFEGDVGHPPSTLRDLVKKPDSISVYNPIARLGWHGPYIDSSGGDFLKDSWGADYVYNPAARTITSVGSGSNIVVTF
jgi:type II secretory pathway pseudopilin PulG